MFSGGIEMEHWVKIGYKTHDYIIAWYTLIISSILNLKTRGGLRKSCQTSKIERFAKILTG